MFIVGVGTILWSVIVSNGGGKESLRREWAKQRQKR